MLRIKRRNLRGPTVAFGQLGIEFLQSRRDRAARNDAAINSHHRREFPHGPGGEDFSGTVQLGQRQAALGRGNSRLPGQRQYSRAGDSGQACVGRGRAQHAVFFVDHENVGGVGFGDKAVDVEHERVGAAGQIGLNFRENVVEQVVVVYFGIQRVGGIAALGRCQQGNAGGIVVGGLAVYRFPFRDNDECGAVDIEFRVHGGGAFFSP